MKLLAYRHLILWIGTFGGLALITIFIAPSFGGTAGRLPIWETLLTWFKTPPDASPPIAADILFNLRIPRVLTAFLTGAALSLVGVGFQALLRNPLADPYTLGVASGGAFGAAFATFLSVKFTWMAFTWGPFSGIQCFAFGGALFAVIMIYLLARSGGKISTMELLLAGVTMGMIFAALIMAIRYFTSPTMLKGIDRWMMGGIDGGSWRVVKVMPLMLFPGLLMLLSQARALDQISFGEAMATGRGVNIANVQRMVFFGGSLATASVVAVAGPVGFVGLIVPHTVRRITGPDHRLLMPCATLAGGMFLVICDTVARTILAPAEIPVGVITSILGGPFFIYLLISARKNRLTR